MPAGSAVYLCATFLVPSSVSSVVPFLFLLTSVLCLPDVAQHLAADAGLTRLLPSHHAVRRRKDGDPETAEDAWDLPFLDIYTQSRLANPLDAGQHRVLAAGVAQVDLQKVAVTFGVDAVVTDEALFL